MQTSYQYTDKRKSAGRVYYRIRATEKDGSFLYIGDLQVAAAANLVNGVRLWPSIVKSNASLLINAVNACNAQVEVHDMNGRRLQIMKVFLQAGSNTLPLPLHGLAAGQYTISVKTGNKNAGYTRFIKQD